MSDTLEGKGAARSGLQDESECVISSDSRRMAPSRLQLVLGGITVAIAVVLLLLILIPSIVPLMLAWCVVEVLFWLTRSIPTAAKLDAQPAEGHWPVAAAKHDLTAFNRFLKYCQEVPGKVDYRKYLSGWFLGADFDSIKRENIEEFVAYGFCFKSRQQLAAEGKGDMPSRMTDQLEQIWDIESPPGYNPDIKFMAHLWEPLNAAYRPLAWYLFLELVAYCSRHYLKCKGFEAHRHAGINYYTLHLQGQDSKAARKQATDGSSTLPAAVPQQQAANASSSSNSSTSSAAKEASADAVCAPDGQLRQLASLDTTAAEADSTIDAQQQQQLHTIMEQSTIPCLQQQQLQPATSQDEPFTNDSAVTDRSQRPPSPPRHQSNTSDLSESDLALLESPFAINLSGQFSEDLAGAGLIPESELMLDLPAAEAAKSAAAAATAAGDASKPGWKRAQSMPASAAAAAAAAIAADAEQQQQQQQQQQQRLKQRASCSVLQRRLTTRASTMPRGYKMKPLQAALSQALSEAGILEAGVPVVFLHGIGGLPAYLELLNYLEAEGSPLLAVEVKSVAMRLGPVYSVGEVATAVLGMMDKMRVRKACFVAHSYGTFVASYIAKQHPQRMRGCVLIDPVCMGMFMPNLIYNFLYKKPVWQGWGKPQLVAYVKAVVRSFVSSEVHVRASVARRFYWTELCAWPEDLPAGSTVLLSGKDDLMDSPEVETMLKDAKHLKVRNNEELTHGAFLLNKEVKQAIRLELQALLATSGSAVVGLAHQLSTLVHPAAAAGAALPSKASVAVRQALRKVQSLRPQRSSNAGSGSDGPSSGEKAAANGDGVGAGKQRVPVSRSLSESAAVRRQQQRQLGAGQSEKVAGGAGKAGEVGPAGDAECDVATAVADQQ